MRVMTFAVFLSYTPRERHLCHTPQADCGRAVKAATILQSPARAISHIQYPNFSCNQHDHNTTGLDVHGVAFRDNHNDTYHVRANCIWNDRPRPAYRSLCHHMTTVTTAELLPQHHREMGSLLPQHVFPGKPANHNTRVTMESLLPQHQSHNRISLPQHRCCPWNMGCHSITVSRHSRQPQHHREQWNLSYHSFTVTMESPLPQHNRYPSELCSHSISGTTGSCQLQHNRYPSKFRYYSITVTTESPPPQHPG